MSKTNEGKDLNRGYFPLWRKIVDWGWYKDGNTARVFIHLLLLCSHKDSDYMGTKILKGQCVTGRKSLSAALSISEQSIRTALKHLKSTNEITITPHQKFSIITLNKFDKYTPDNYLNQGKSTSELTSNQPATNQQLTTSNNYKNYKNNIYTSPLAANTPPSAAHPPLSRRFDELWKDYPKKLGRKAAEKHYKASVKTEEDWVNIRKALANYLNSQTVANGFIKHGSTWFNNWQDWIEDPDPKKKGVRYV